MTLATSIIEKQNVIAAHQSRADEMDTRMRHQPDGPKFDGMAKMRDEHLNNRDQSIEDLEMLKTQRSMMKYNTAMNEELFG